MPGFPVRQISYDNIKEGDLLYFPGHIAMYIGEGEYIHSTARPGSDGVVINSLNPAADNYRRDLAESIYAAGSVFGTWCQTPVPARIKVKEESGHGWDTDQTHVPEGYEGF